MVFLATFFLEVDLKGVGIKFHQKLLFFSTATDVSPRTSSKELKYHNNVELKNKCISCGLFRQTSYETCAAPKGRRLDDNLKLLCVYPLYQLITFSTA